MNRVGAEKLAGLVGDDADARSVRAQLLDDALNLPKPGTYRWLCVAYFRSKGDFLQLDPRTQRLRRAVLEATFDEPIAPGSKLAFADVLLDRMTAKAVKVLRDRKASLPEAAHDRVKAIRRVFAWGVEQELVEKNPARDVPYLRSGSTGHHTWTPEEAEQFEARHPVGTKARLAMALLLYTGVRRSDVILLGKQHVRQGWLTFTVQKNRKRKPVTVEIPLLPVLQQIIDASPTGPMTYLMTEQGKPFSLNGFGNWFRDRCNEAGLQHCSAHGLRKAGASIAAGNGATPHQLMSIYGWLTLSQAERYTRAAERKRMAAEGMPLLVRPPKNETA
jgi:integrase